MNTIYFFLLIIAFLFCCKPLAKSPEQERVKLFIPASTFYLFETLLKEELCKGNTCSLSYASSASLARQILHLHPEARPDLYISADSRWMERLGLEAMILKKSRKRLFSNRLLLSARKIEKGEKSSSSLETSNIGLPRLRGANTSKSAQMDIPLFLKKIFKQVTCWSTGDPDSTPLGYYARESLQNMGLWKFAKERIRGAADARRALQALEKGECELGILYKSDHYRNEKIQMLYEFPAKLHKPIHYEIALLKRDKTPAMRARAIYNFLTTAQTKKLYLKFGFSP